MKKILFKTLMFNLLIIGSLSLSLTVNAQTQASGTPASPMSTISNQADVMRDVAGFGDARVGNIAAGVIQAALALLAIIFLVIVIFAGYRWMTASGNEEQVKKAQDAIKRGIIGLIIVVLAYAITAFVFTQLPFDGVGGNSGGGHITG